MIVAWFLVGLLAALVIVQMTRPRLKRLTLSSARFFAVLPPPQRRLPLLRWGSPVASRAFWLQLLALLLLLAAILSALPHAVMGQTQSISTWLLLDTSASMSTRQHGETRMAAARQEIGRAVAVAQSSGEGVSLCWKLTAFDDERRDLLSTADGAEVVRQAEALDARPLGTDLDLVRALPALLADQSADSCPLTHLVVITDQPDPTWVAEPGMPPIIWIDVGVPVDNAGLTRVEAMRDRLTGVTQRLLIELTAFGQAPSGASLQIIAPDGTVDELPAAWQQTNLWPTEIDRPSPGTYTLRLSPGGAYAFDDTATIQVSAGQSIRIDWQATDRTLIDQIGQGGLWLEDRVQPDLRVLPWPSPLDAVPTLLIGEGYAPVGSEATQEVRDFQESSPLLADLNLDVAERMGIQDVVLPDDFVPVLRGIGAGGQGVTWLAQRDSPRAAYVPGLPILTDDDAGRFSTTVFFNAARWLLQTRPLPPLYTLTTPAQPEPDGTRLALHLDEGNTAQPPHSYGKIQDLQPVAAEGTGQPLWPVLLLLAAVVFGLERLLSAWGNARWR